MTNLHRSKEDDLSAPENYPENMKVAVFKLPVARNERNGPPRLSPPQTTLTENYP